MEEQKLEVETVVSNEELNAEENQAPADPLAFFNEKPTKKLSKIEKRKLRVIKKLLMGEINGTEAAKKLNITTRQVRNLKRQVLNEGYDGVVHKNKNYKPYNTYDTEISTFVCKLYISHKALLRRFLFLAASLNFSSVISTPNFSSNFSLRIINSSFQISFAYGRS